MGSSIRAIVAPLALLVALPVLADGHRADKASVFVPYERYDPAKRDEYRLRNFSGGCGEEEVEAMLDASERAGFIFSIDNVVATFPNIFNSDRLNIGCNKQPLRMEFLSVMSSNTLMAKTVVCEALRNGLQCQPPVETERYFLVEPERTIEVSNDVTFEEAVVFVEWFRHDAGPFFSESEKKKAQQLAWRMAVGRDGELYTLRVGDPYCECVLKLRLEAGGQGVVVDQIAVDGKPRFVCP